MFLDYYAWRNASNGSWFIQSLCAVFMQYGHQMELMQVRKIKTFLLDFVSNGCKSLAEKFSLLAVINN